MTPMHLKSSGVRSCLTHPFTLPVMFSYPAFYAEYLKSCAVAGMTGLVHFKKATVDVMNSYLFFKDDNM